MKLALSKLKPTRNHAQSSILPSSAHTHASPSRLYVQPRASTTVREEGNATHGEGDNGSAEGDEEAVLGRDLVGESDEGVEADDPPRAT
jgi:hypothetical protein